MGALGTFECVPWGIFTLQHWLILGSKQKFLCDTYKTLLLPLPMCIKRKQVTIQATNAADY